MTTSSIPGTPDSAQPGPGTGVGPGTGAGPARRLLAAAGAMAMTAGVAAALTPEAHADSGLAAGNVVVYRVGDGSATLSGSGAPVYLDEYSPSGTLLTSVALPTAAAGAEKPIVGSGSATSEGGLTLSADSRYLVATGYDAAVGATGLSGSAAASVPRTIARVDGQGAVDTTTALTDFADGNNPRSAVSQDGAEFWVGGAAGGVRYAPLGATTSTQVVANTYKNVRQLDIFDGQLYASADPTKAGVTVATVGTGLPTSGTNAVADLPFAAATAPVEPYAYALLTLGSGPGPDTLYVADNSVGAVVKYGLVSGSWTRQGSVAVPNVTGVTANDAGGTVTLYATSAGASGTAGHLLKITDASGIGGALSGSANVIANAPAGEAFRGVAFAPGTVIGSGGGTAPTNPAPTIATAEAGLPATQGDPDNPTLAVTVGDQQFPAGRLSVTVTSSDQAVAPASGLAVTGTGADRVLSVTPGAVGTANLTVTVTAPDGTSASTDVQYGVSAGLGDPTQRSYYGAGNASSAIDVGGGYMIVADDENNVLRLYDENHSGTPVKTFDFRSLLPAGTAEADLEAAARQGDTIYWTGSMSNNSSGVPQPSRSTLFATKITGSGADTELTYVGSYSGLQSDLVAWDHNNGSGLGADYFGFAASVQAGVDGHGSDALNVEGMEFAPSDPDTAYLAFRAPLEPTTDRHLALIVPVTNVAELADSGNPGSVHATFGAPIQMDLGGLGIREIRKNADGQYLIIAGTADESNNAFVLYTWDGNPLHPPIKSDTALPLEPAGADQGSWETIVSVPDQLTAGTPFELVQDNGDTAWYGDGRTSKSGLLPALEKDLGQTFVFQPGAQLTTTTTVAAQSTTAVTGQSVTYTATVTGPAGTLGAPTGTVSFQNGGVDVPGCSAVALVPSDVAGGATSTATCTVAYSATGPETVTAVYAGDGTFGASAAAAGSTVTVGQDATVTTVTSASNPAASGAPFTVQARVAAAAPGSGTPTGTVTFSAQVGTKSVPLACSGVQGGAGLAAGTATCAVDPKSFGAVAGTTYTITASYSGDAAFSAGSGTFQQQIARIATAPVISAPSTVLQGLPALFAVGIDTGAHQPLPLGAGGSFTVTVTSASGKQVSVGCLLVNGIGGLCAVPGSALTAAQGPYTITVAYSGDAHYAPSSASVAFSVETLGRR